ncbi:MAG: family rane protein [Solirubrobacterales bacterium]|nr:family rane protein [Solirubrobacterales bacterium]
MRGPRARLGAFVATLSVLAVAVLVLAPVSEEGLRDALDPFGAAAPLAYVAIGAVLGSLFVPGPILAGASGLLFGTTTGFFVTIGSTVGSTVIAVLAARHAGRAGVEDLDHPRVKVVEALIQHHAVGAVVVQRLLPAIPDAPCSYLFGLAGLRVWQVVVGTVIGAAPRAFSYTAIGDGLGEGGSAIGIVGLVVLVATGVVGTVVAAVLARRARRSD